MSVIDTFLKLMVEKRAERLVLATGGVPFLLRAGETIELSMPALRGEMLRRISTELAGGEAEDFATRREGCFRSSEGASFGYVVLPDGGDLRIEIHGPGPEPPVAGDGAPSAREHPAGPVPLPPVAPGFPELLAVVDQAVSLEASDIFLSSGRPPRMRRKGVLSRIDGPPPSEEQIVGLIPGGDLRAEFGKAGSVDFAVRWELSEGGTRLRVNVFRHIDGVAAALRPIRRRIPPLAELGLPEDLLRLVSFPGGLVLVTGTSGSGKSTTLAALVDHLNRTRQRHVITIEDPVEYEHREIQCLIHQREVGRDVGSFGTGLRAALRENPDVILLGEMRDLDTISAALTAAETGHLVLGTLHSGSASAAVSRIVDVFPGHQQPHIRTQLASSLRAVLSQRLIPVRGDKGLLPVLEKLIVNPAVANGIREGQDHHIRNAMLTGADEGMITLERSLAVLVRKGAIDRETAFRHAMDPKALGHQLE